MVMEKLSKMVDLEGLAESGEYVTPFNSYYEYESLIDQNEFDEMIERDEIKKHFDVYALDKSEPFLFVDSSGIDGGEVFVGEDRLNNLLHYMKNEPQTYSDFIKHESISAFILSEVETKLDNNAVDYELEENRFETVIHINDKSLEDTKIVINDSFLSLSERFDPEPNYFEYDSLDELLEVIDQRIIKPVPLKFNSREMEM